MRRYGSDKPDLRIGCEFTDITDLLTATEFKVFRLGDRRRPRRRAARARRARRSRASRSTTCAASRRVGRQGRGLDEDRGRAARSIRRSRSSSTTRRWPPSSSGPARGRATRSSSAPRRQGGLRFHGRAAPETRRGPGPDRRRAGASLWVTDFPMFEWCRRGAAGRRRTIRSPRPAPDRRRSSTERARGPRCAQYDMVLNGNEIGGGSIRIHRPEMQSAVFELLGISRRARPRRTSASCSTRSVWRAAARRHRLRHRPAGDADGRGRFAARGDRLPQGPGRGRSADRRAHVGASAPRWRSSACGCSTRPL